MFLELESVFNTPGLSQAFDFKLPASYDQLPFARPPVVTGTVKNRAGVVSLEGTAQVRLLAQCDRCAQAFHYEQSVPLKHTLVLSLNSENSLDEYVLLDSYRFSPDDLVWEDIVLALPPKVLCDEDCKGLCHRCGANRNESNCNCTVEDDPRLAALRQLLE